jgi:hypothetical protein
MAGGAGDGDGHMVADHLGADHGHRLALGRVDLARHDRRARLVLRQMTVRRCRARARAQQADVVGDLEQAGGQRVERARGSTSASCAASASNLFGGDEGQAGDLGGLLGELLGEADLGVEAGADRGAALGQLQQARQGRFDRGRCRIRPARHSRRIPGRASAASRPGMGAADLDDVGEGLGLGVQRRAAPISAGHQPVLDLLDRGDMHGGREAVVRRLAHIDVVVGMDRLLRAHLAAQHLDGAVRDHLVGVHVGLGAGAGLPHQLGIKVTSGTAVSWLAHFRPM